MDNWASTANAASFISELKEKQSARGPKKEKKPTRKEQKARYYDHISRKFGTIIHLNDIPSGTIFFGVIGTSRGPMNHNQGGFYSIDESREHVVDLGRESVDYNLKKLVQQGIEYMHSYAVIVAG